MKFQICLALGLAFASACATPATNADLSKTEIRNGERLVFGRFVHEHDYSGATDERLSYRVDDEKMGLLQTEFTRATFDSYDHFFWMRVSRKARKITLEQITVGQNGYSVDLRGAGNAPLGEVTLADVSDPVYIGDVVVETVREKLPEPLIGGPGGYIFHGIFLKKVAIRSDPHAAERFLSIRYEKSGFATALVKLNLPPK